MHMPQSDIAQTVGLSPEANPAIGGSRRLQSAGNLGRFCSSGNIRPRKAIIPCHLKSRPQTQLFSIDPGARGYSGSDIDFRRLSVGRCSCDLSAELSSQIIKDSPALSFLAPIFDFRTQTRRTRRGVCSQGVAAAENIAAQAARMPAPAVGLPQAGKAGRT